MWPEGRSWILVSCLILGLTCHHIIAQDDPEEAQEFNVGVGIGDVTGPAAELGMMGYASASQIAKGIHTRLFARAFIFEDEIDRVVYVSVDCAMIGQAVKLEVVNELKKKFGATRYTSKNVLLSATHTHSGPGGYMQYALYGISSYGFLMSNFRAVVEGIVESIERADASLQKGKVYTSVGKVHDANINRSPYSYLQNPKAERDLYEDGDTDKTMVLIRVEGSNGEELGLINWFAVHPTSMNNTNRLISGDNKGYASMHVEYQKNQGSRPGQGKFVAAFGSSNLGDVSPNTNGPLCQIGKHAGEQCTFGNSTCGDYTQNCWALGPGVDMVESTKMIGQKQADAAMSLFEEAGKHKSGVYGAIQYAHQYINMSNYLVTLDYGNGTKRDVTTCPGALGYSFAAGTTDGPGAFDFHQGDATGNPFWDLIRDVLHAPTRAQIECHHPKPILLDVGETHFPYEWVPSVVETQMLRVGNVYIVGMPGELTTMAGRRLRKALTETLLNAGEGKDNTVVIAGLSNVYTHYVTTLQEYNVQRYEAASTLYGPHTLDAYIQQFSILTESMLKNTELAGGPTPPFLIKGQISLNPPIIFDYPPPGKKMGFCETEPGPMYAVGETVDVTFVSGHPRNHPMRGGTFFLVEKRPVDYDQSENPRWEIVATDADWNTKFTWGRPFALSPWSEIDFQWDMSQSPIPITTGVYRIRHFGYYKPALKAPLPYTGESITFKVCEDIFSQECKDLYTEEPTRKINSVSNLWTSFVTRG